jgi:CubicO group peptidase (beta-lactamase class C family)
MSRCNTVLAVSLRYRERDFTSVRRQLRVIRTSCAALAIMASCASHAETTGAENAASDGLVAEERRVELFADGIVASIMREHAIPALTLSVVKDGEIILAKGYGHADALRTVPVDPHSTLFRIGSVTKTFTWTAIMQLAEQGRIDLDTDVNAYLGGMQVDAFEGQPLTLREMMSHRAGFEEAGAPHLFETEADEVLPFEAWMRAHVPVRVRPPGEALAYSNYASLLAGLIVEKVSGLSYDAYLKRHLFAPLGMHDTTVREPVPGSEWRLERFAEGFQMRLGRSVPYGFEYIGGIAPAGAGSSTAVDMAAYMLAHLQNGRLGDRRILHDSTVEQMRRRAYSDRSSMSDFAHGFLNGKVDGYEFWGHGGLTSTFSTTMMMWPELQFGVFVSINQVNGGAASSQIPHLLLRALFEPRTTIVDLEPPAGASERAAQLDGTYLNTRRSYTQLEKALQLKYGVLRASVTEEGYLLLSSGADTSSWVEVAPLTFRNARSAEVMTFDADASGRILRLNDASGYASFDRVGFVDTRGFIVLAGCLALIFAVTTLIGASMRMREAAVQTWADHCSAIYAVIVIASCWLVWRALDSLSFAAWPPRQLSVAVWALNALAIASIFMLVGIAAQMRARGWSRSRSLHRLLFALASLLWLGALWRWNLLGIHY